MMPFEYQCVCGHHIHDELKCKDCDCEESILVCVWCGHSVQDHDFCKVDSKIQCSHCKCRVFLGC